MAESQGARKSERNLPPQEEGEELVKERTPFPLYHLDKKTKKPTKEMVGTRAILIAMRKIDASTTRGGIQRQILQDTGKEFGLHSISNWVKILRKLRLIELESIKKTNQTEIRYHMTLEGKIATLAVSLVTDNTGIDHKKLVRR